MLNLNIGETDLQSYVTFWESIQHKTGIEDLSCTKTKENAKKIAGEICNHLPSWKNEVI